jgi:DUF2075 family protein
LIVYSGTKEQFTNDVFNNVIEERILAELKRHAGHSASSSEIKSWQNSMQYMNNALIGAGVPEDAGVAIEYKIPLTSKRVDFILSGLDSAQKEVVIIVELKQWTKAESTSKDAIVQAFVGGAKRELLHPSYQAWTYASLIRDFNETVQKEQIALKPCAYLHNCVSNEVINSPHYDQHTLQAPAFLKSDAVALQNFLKRYVKYGDKSQILYRIDNGKLKPSKNLADHLLSLLQGNKEFKLVDDQKLVFEKAIELSDISRVSKKQVLIVDGGPGTGKSVVAINLLVEFTQKERLAHYVTRNAAPRAVYESKLTGNFTKSHISNLFKGSGSYTESPQNSMDVLIVDEAHRLNERSGLYQNQGENQIKEIIESARCSIFFIDEFQRVTLKDIGEKQEIRNWAEKCGAEVTQMTLASQFRCNGSDGFLAWVDHTLQIRETANDTLEDIDYDFRVCNSPNELRALIAEKNYAANKARMVAGYCWDWKGKKDPSIYDVVIPEYEFEMRWNLDSDSSLWIVKPDSVGEVGCIHTCQGLELDYVGVIVGPDFVIRDGRAVTDAGKRSSQDRSIHGYKKMLREDPDRAQQLTERIIKNTYRTLITRGQKGCYLYSVDQETNAYFQQFVESASSSSNSSEKHSQVQVDLQ